MGNDYYENIEDIKRDIENGIPVVGIGERCFINNAIVDKNCRIGNDVYIKGGKHLADTANELYCVKEGIVVIRKGAIIPNNFVIE
jgi:glucose-1-phosphate adenylyltransferase